jgi:outer membrane lipoprotein LolB
MARASALAALAVLALLAGCRTRPPEVVAGPGADAPWPEQRAALEQFDRYSLSGRVAVAANGQGFTAGLRYAQQPKRADLSLDGPLGIGGLRIGLDGADIEVTNSRGQQLDGPAAREEIETRLGFELPLDELRWWLLGLPAPGKSDVETAPDSGEIRGFVQNGWHVLIDSRAPALGFSLPRRLTAERGGTKMKLLVEKWQ